MYFYRWWFIYLGYVKKFFQKVLTCPLRNDIMTSATKEGESIKIATIKMPDDVHKFVKIICVTEDTTIQNYVMHLIYKDLKSRGINTKE